MLQRHALGLKELGVKKIRHNFNTRASNHLVGITKKEPEPTTSGSSNTKHKRKTT